eukprot:UC1_evm2s235
MAVDAATVARVAAAPLPVTSAARTLLCGFIICGTIFILATTTTTAAAAAAATVTVKEVATTTERNFCVRHRDCLDGADGSPRFCSNIAKACTDCSRCTAFVATGGVCPKKCRTSTIEATASTISAAKTTKKHASPPVSAAATTTAPTACVRHRQCLKTLSGAFQFCTASRKCASCHTGCSPEGAAGGYCPRKCTGVTTTTTTTTSSITTTTVDKNTTTNGNATATSITIAISTTVPPFKACKLNRQCLKSQFCHIDGMCAPCAECTKIAAAGNCPKRCAAFMPATTSDPARKPCRHNRNCDSTYFCDVINNVCAPCAACTQGLAKGGKCPSKCDNELALADSTTNPTIESTATISRGASACNSHRQCKSNINDRPQYCVASVRMCADCIECTPENARFGKCPGKCDAAKSITTEAPSTTTTPTSCIRNRDCADIGGGRDPYFCHKDSSVCTACAECTSDTVVGGSCPKRCTDGTTDECDRHRDCEVLRKENKDGKEEVIPRFCSKDRICVDCTACTFELARFSKCPSKCADLLMMSSTTITTLTTTTSTTTMAPPAPKPVGPLPCNTHRACSPVEFCAKESGSDFYGQCTHCVACDETTSMTSKCPEKCFYVSVSTTIANAVVGGETKLPPPLPECNRHATCTFSTFEGYQYCNREMQCMPCSTCKASDSYNAICPKKCDKPWLPPVTTTTEPSTTTTTPPPECAKHYQCAFEGLEERYCTLAGACEGCSACHDYKAVGGACPSKCNGATPPASRSTAAATTTTSNTIDSGGNGPKRPELPDICPIETVSVSDCAVLCGLISQVVRTYIPGPDSRGCYGVCTCREPEDTTAATISTRSDEDTAATTKKRCRRHRECDQNLFCSASGACTSCSACSPDISVNEKCPVKCDSMRTILMNTTAAATVTMIDSTTTTGDDFALVSTTAPPAGSTTLNTPECVDHFGCSRPLTMEGEERFCSSSGTCEPCSECAPEDAAFGFCPDKCGGPTTTTPGAAAYFCRDSATMGDFVRSTCNQHCMEPQSLALRCCPSGLVVCNIEDRLDVSHCQWQPIPQCRRNEIAESASTTTIASAGPTSVATTIMPTSSVITVAASSKASTTQEASTTTTTKVAPTTTTITTTTTTTTIATTSTITITASTTTTFGPIYYCRASDTAGIFTVATCKADCTAPTTLTARCCTSGLSVCEFEDKLDVSFCAHLSVPTCAPSDKPVATTSTTTTTTTTPE